MIEEQIISKMLDERNVHSVLKHNVTVADFQRDGAIFEYVVNYRKDNGDTPDVETVVSEFPDFEYMVGVHEPFSGLAKRLKQSSAKRQVFELIAQKAQSRFQDMDGDDFVSWMADEVERIQRDTATDYSVGTDFARNGQERKERYLESKEKGTEQYIDLPYGDIQAEVGDYALILAYTNRGKSWISSDIAIQAWKTQGKNVLYYSPELSQKQQQQRFETLDAHFNNTKLKRGELDNESEYFDYVDRYDLDNADSPKMLIKTMEDLPKGLSLDVIEADLEMNPDMDIVVIDGFNLMNHGKINDRNAMTTTSRRLRQMFSRHSVLGLVTHQTTNQAEKDNKEFDDLGERMVKAPPIESYSESIALIQDPALILTFDQHDGVGEILVAKARDEYVGKTIKLHCDFNEGYIYQPKVPDITSVF